MLLKKLIPMQDVVSNMGDTITRVLPESTVIEYLLNAKASVLLSVEEYLKRHSKVPFINLYQGNNIASFLKLFPRFLSAVIILIYKWQTLCLSFDLCKKGKCEGKGAALNKNDYLFQSIYNIKKTSPFYGVHEICVGYR